MPLKSPPSIRLVDAKGAFWTASVMATGTWVSVATGPIDDPTKCQAKIHKFATAALARGAFDDLVRQAKADGFVDPRAFRAEPPRASADGRARLDQAIALLRLRAEELHLVLGEPCAVHLDGELERLGRSTSGQTWELAPTYRTFLEVYGRLAVGSGDDVLSLHDATGAALATADLESALLDPHRRPGEWPSADLSRYGIDRAIVFASCGRGWMDGWAFDTRIVGPDGEHAIRRTYDFSADDGAAMGAEWPANDALTAERPLCFADWLADRLDDLAGRG